MYVQTTGHGTNRIYERRFSIPTPVVQTVLCGKSTKEHIGCVTLHCGEPRSSIKTVCGYTCDLHHPNSVATWIL